MRAGVIIFHKNITKIYKKRWVERCLDSIRSQTYRDFFVYEIDYGGTNKQIYEGSIFYNIKMETHAHAHNFLLDQAVKECECVFNVNLDDFYTENRFERQIEYMKRGYDVVSCNFVHIDGNDNVLRSLRFHKHNIRRELRRNHNVIGHPAVCYSRKFWLNCTRLIPEEIPFDDMKLWQRSIYKFKFLILRDILLYYRIHENQICK